MSEIHLRHEYWRHEPTGRVWAVELTEGRIVGAAGPLDLRDATIDLLPYLSYDFREVRWIEQERNHLRPEIVE